MSRYIDADELTLKIRHFFCKMIIKSEPIMTDDGEVLDLKIVNPLLEANKAIANIIREQPTADVVEVVRCRDCSNWDRHWISSLFSENVHYCAFIDGPCSSDFYCAAAIKSQVLGGDKH